MLIKLELCSWGVGLFGVINLVVMRISLMVMRNGCYFSLNLNNVGMVWNRMKVCWGD